MNPSSERSPESLISEQDWVRPLVQRLVRDEASAQDVLQSARLRALRSPPRADVGSLSWRSWFARVARNIALRQGERDGARRERESRVARGESIPSTLEIVEREEQRAKIVAHVLALPEPYKTTLVLRFYEGLEPRAIARAQGTNASTVRNRIARGLALLRERLQREQGKEWVSACLAVLPLGGAKLLVAHAGATSWIAKGAIVVKKIEVAAAAALVLTAGAVWFAWPSNSGPDGLGGKSAARVALSKDDADLAAPPANAAAGAALDSSDSASGERSDAQQRRPAVDPALAAAATGVRVYGTVRDAGGHPINEGGGTFSFQLGGGQQVAELPLVEFYSKETPQQTQGLEYELSARLESKRVEDVLAAKRAQLLLSLDSSAGAETAATEERLDAAAQAELGSVLKHFVLLGSTRIVFADSEGCQFTARTNFDSSYSVEGLHAGKWQAIVTHDGKLCRRQDFEIEKDELQHKLDLSLDDALSVRIKLRTPDGRELGAAIAADPELSVHVALSPVALRPGSAARYLPDGENQNYGCGTYQPRAQLDPKRREEIGDASGVLTITEPPPLDIGLSMCGQLIARRPLSPGQEEVEFVLSLEDLRRRFTTVIVHVVDAQTHAPIVGAGVSIDGVRSEDRSMKAAFLEAVARQAQADLADEERVREDERKAAQDSLTDAEGVARIPWVVPGTRRVFVSIHSHAAFSGRFQIEAGPIRELPPIELTGHARISGRVLDPQGQPVKAGLQLMPLDRFDETREDLAGCVWVCSENGTFEIEHQRRERYVLRVAEGQIMPLPIVVDTTQGDVGDLELHLVEPGQVQLTLTREPKEGAELRIATAAGLPVLERDLSGLEPIELSLPPGSYQAELREGAHRAGSVRFVVGKERVRAVLPLD